MANKFSIGQLKQEFNEVQLEFVQLHNDMNHYRDAYEHNIFYQPKRNQPLNTDIGVNLLQVFADKNWFYLSPMPKTSVPPTPETRESADKREKYLNSTHEKNNLEALWQELTFDGTVLGCAITETTFDVRARCNKIRRIDPRRAYWQKSDANNEGIDVFWTAVPMTREKIQRKYGKTPTGDDGLTLEDIAENASIPTDGKDYFLVVTRVDAEKSVTWAGSTYLIQPHNHLQGKNPYDIAMPLKLANFDNHPDFYLRRLERLQAEFNELFRQRGNIVRRLGNPLVWGTGIYKNTKADIEETLRTNGGFVGLKENGTLSLLTIPETKMIDSSLNDVFQRMKDVAGFPTATFGEVVGANTSGDALGMYFTPTQRAIDHQNVAYKAMLKSINMKILANVEQFLLSGETVSATGYSTHGTLVFDEVGRPSYQSGGYETQLTIDDIQGNHFSVVTMQAVTPKDEIAYKSLIAEMMRDGTLSRVRGYDEIGFQSPEDELALLEEEQSNPAFNSDVMNMMNQPEPVEETTTTTAGV